MNKEKFLKIMEIGFLILIILSFIFTIILYLKTIDLNFNYLSSLSLNWQKGPIISVFSTNETTCPNNSSFITDLYPGTFRACGTVSGPIPFGTGCPRRVKTIYYEIPPTPYYKWRNTTLCSDRLLSNYLSLPVVKSSKDCPKGERSCGVIDTSNNILCLPTDKSCPFNYIEFSQTKPSQIQNNTTIQLNDIYLKLSNNFESYKILNEFIINEDVPCLNTRYKSYKASIFPIEIYAQNTQCVNTFIDRLDDPNVELKDSYDFYSVYDENGINNKLFNVTTYSVYSANLKTSKRNLGLYTKSYIGIANECFNIIKEKNLSQTILDDLINFDKKMTNSGGFVIVALVFGAIDVVLSIAISYLVLFCDCCDFTKENDKVASHAKRVFTHLSVILLNISFFVVAILVTSNSLGVEANFKILLENDCIKDEFTNIFLVYSYNILTSSKNLGISILITSGSTLFGFIVFIIIGCCCCQDEDILPENEEIQGKQMMDKKL